MKNLVQEFTFAKIAIGTFASVFVWAISISNCLATDTVDPKLLSAMEWRLVGQFRGGRVTTVAGVPDNPQLYYMGDLKGDWVNLHDELRKISTSDIAALNNWARTNTIPHISPPTKHLGE